MRWAVMATGPTGRHVVMFGGEDLVGVTASTWRCGELASVRSFGVGCGVPPLTLAAVPGSQPVLGQSFESVVTAVPAGGLPFLAYGVSDTFAGSVPLPIDLTPLGMTGCYLYHDLLALGYGCTPAGGAWSNSLPLQNQPVFVGTEIFAQVYAWAPGSNPFGLLTSNALGLDPGLP